MGTLISKHLSRATGRSIRVERAVIRPLGRIEVQGLQADFLESDGFEKDSFLRFEKLRIRFRVLPLLARRLAIKEILLEKPTIHLTPILPEKQDVPQKKIEEIRPPEKAQSEVKITSPKTLPLHVGLFQLLLRDFRLTVRLPRDAGDADLSLEGVHLDISDLRVPRKFRESPEGIGGKFQMYSETGQIRFRVRESDLVLKIAFRAAGEWQTGGLWNLQADADVKSSLNTDESTVRFSLGVRGKGYGEQIVLEKAALILGGQVLAGLSGEVSDVGPDATFHMRVDSDDLNVENLMETARLFLPETLLKPLDSIRAEGRLKLLHGDIQGNPDRIKFLVRSDFKEGMLRADPGGLKVERIRSGFEAAGIYTSKGIQDGRLSGEIELGQAIYTPNNSTSLSIKNTAFHFNSFLDKKGIPLQGSLEGRISKILNGSVSLNCHWDVKADSAIRWEQSALSGRLQADSLHVDAFPGLPPGIDGKLQFLTHIDAQGLKNVTIRSDVISPGLSFIVADSMRGLLPVHGFMKLCLGIDPELEHVILDSGRVGFNDVFSGYLTGRFNLADRQFDIALHDGKIRNSPVADYLPDELAEQWGEIKLAGEEQLFLSASGRQFDDSMAVSINAELRFFDAGVDYPAQNLRIKDVEGVIGIEGALNRLQGKMNMDVGSILYSSLRSEPVHDIHLGLLFRQHGDSLEIENGRLLIEPMGFHGKFLLNLKGLRTSPDIETDFAFGFQSKDTIEMIQNVRVLGGCSFHIAIETIDPFKQHYQVRGSLTMDSLYAAQGTLLQADNVNGRVPFYLNLNLKEMSLLSDSAHSVYDWLDYESQRDVYRYFFPSLGNITAEEVHVKGYHIQNVQLDMAIQNGQVQIPWFYMDALDGNVGGAFRADLGEGGLNNITYAMRANVSRINSAVLADFESKDIEETELNASLDFEGKGIDVNEGIDLDGTFYLTKMGRKFAGTLLEAMDPKGTDRSIQLTQKLLKAGWKPKLFSFELRHGYVYPTLSLSQPWFSPIRIPGNLEYGRLPLAFFLKK